MKKKISVLILAFCVSFSFIACEKDESASKPKADSLETSKNQELPPVEKPAEESKEESPKQPVKETSLADLEQYLLDSGLISGERTEKSASLIGAISGFGYGDQDAEVYEFDENSEAYKNMKETNSLTLEGFDFSMTPAAINGKYVLIFSNNSEPNQSIVDVFNSYGK